MEKETENKNHNWTINIGKSTIKEMHLKIIRAYQKDVFCLFLTIAIVEKSVQKSILKCS